MTWRLLLLILTTVAVAAEEPPLIVDGKLDVAAAVAYFDTLYRSDSSTATMEMTVIRPRLERTLTMESRTAGKDKALIVITAPPREAGTATLKVDKNLWNYLPRIKRTIRIPPSMMLTSWMGSDFTNDDLVQESSFTDDYTHELVGESAEPPGWTLRFTAKPGVVGLWSRFDLTVTPDGRIPLVARYYDRKGRLSRTLYWDEVKVFDGKKLPSRMTLVPEDQEGQKTIMVYRALDFDVELPEGTFSLSELERSK